MLGLSELSAFALFLLTPCYCVGRIPLTPTSTLFNDTAEISFAPSLALDNLTDTISSSSFLGVTPSDPYLYTRPHGQPGQLTLENWGRPWIKKASIETLMFNALFKLSASATAPVPWRLQIWTGNAGFVYEWPYYHGRLVLSLQKDPTRAVGLPFFFQDIQIGIALLRGAVQQFEDWVPQTELEFEIPHTFNPLTFQYAKGYLRLITQAADNISQDLNSTSFLVGDY